MSGEDTIGNLKIDIPIHETKIKGKKEYKQHLIKIPKKMVTLLNIKKGDLLRVEFIPLEPKQKYPNFKMEIIRENETNRKK